MITITAKDLISETRTELVEKFDKFRTETLSKMGKIQIFSDSEFAYTSLKTKLEICTFLEHYLLDNPQKNWFCMIKVNKPIKTIRKFNELLEATRDLIIAREPNFDLRYNSVYFMTLHYLTKIEVQDDGT